VAANEQRLRQALLNLLSNAIKYSAAETPVTVEITVYDTASVRVSVRDNGPGITCSSRLSA
jgi:signal transduction histidine kinase